MKRVPVARQRGITLIVSMIMLLVLTIMGLSSIRDTSLEEKMAGNLRNSNVAFQAAESALRGAEDFLTCVDLADFDGTDGLYQPLPTMWAAHAASWGQSSLVRTFGGTLAGIAAPPVYIIERISSAGSGATSVAAGQVVEDCSPGFYRITARAVGNTDTSVAMLQTVYLRD